MLTSAALKPTNAGGPRVLVEPSDYVLRNVGDMAMLRVAIERLRANLPTAMIEVLTDQPDALKALCPSAIPLPGRSRHLWLRDASLQGVLEKILPRPVARRVRRRMPSSLAERLEHSLGERSDFVNSVKHADLLVVAGMGGITDYFPEYAVGVLKTMKLAINLKRRVVMVGQGMGPLEHTGLRQSAAAVLPSVDLIALREGRAGLPLLRDLGVDPRRIIVTGDDAVQMAFDLRAAELGGGIGINLRASVYSGIDAAAAESLGQVLREASEALEAPLVPLPVSRVPGEADVDILHVIMPDKKQELEEAIKIASPEELIRQVQRCRIVVTGSYHAGVFALASGIPAIGIAGTTYYRDKFEGLAGMFGRGCEVVSLTERDCIANLRRSIRRLWDRAERLRPGLKAAAEEQIDASRAVYAKIAQLLVEDPETRKRDAQLS